MAKKLVKFSSRTDKGALHTRVSRWFCLSLLLAPLLIYPALQGLQAPGDGSQSWPDLPNVRGTVKSIHGRDAIIQTEAGQTYTIHTSDNTHIFKSRQPIKMGDVQAGDMLMAAGEMAANSNLLRAVFVGDVDAATVEKMRAELGKTWIAGKVLKIEEARITVDRMDHKTQVIEADDTTSFRKDGQSVTLLNVHVGDAIHAKGTLKNGVFVPTQLTVIDPAYRRHRGEGVAPDQP
jgi:hypothetical protein